MKLPDIEFKYRNDPGLLEWSDHVRIILNLGRYQFRIVGGVPDWTADSGEAVIYASGNIRRLYVYIDGSWDYIGWDSEGYIENAGTPGEMWDDDEDTGIQTQESTDEDILRFDTGDTAGGSAGERATIDYLGLALTSGLRVTLDGRTGDTYSRYNSTSEYMEFYVDGTKRLEM